MAAQSRQVRALGKAFTCAVVNHFFFTIAALFRDTPAPCCSLTNGPLASAQGTTCPLRPARSTSWTLRSPAAALLWEEVWTKAHLLC